MSPQPALAALIRHVRAELERAGKSEAALDARLIVEHFTSTTRTDAVLDPERAVTPAQLDAVRAAVERRMANEPVHRIIGHREFYGLKLKLSAETLEPRPDTESLVELAIPYVREVAERRGKAFILDIGTGTGAIAISLLHVEQRAHAVAIDISQDALATAAANADMNGVADRFEPLLSDYFEGVKDQRFDVIVSNPPYIPTDVIISLQPEVRYFDPIDALDGGKDGLVAYRAIAEKAAEHLHDDGVVLVEVGYDQPEAVEMIFAANGFALDADATDFGGHRRSLAFLHKR